jgi:hypothetical protein
MGNETYNTIFRSIDRMFIAINSLIDKGQFTNTLINLTNTLINLDTIESFIIDVKSQVPYQQQIRINSIIRDNITNIRSKNDFIPISIDDKLNTL